MRVLGPRPARSGLRAIIVIVMLAVALYSGVVVLRQIDAVQADAGGLPSAASRRRRAARPLRLAAPVVDAPDDVQHRRCPGAPLLGQRGGITGGATTQIIVAKHRITLIPGDGIGPEVTAAVVRILETAGLDVEWEPPPGRRGRDREQHGSTLPAELLESIARNKVALKGPVTTPVGGGFTSVNVGLRKALELFANLRPVWNIPSVPSRYEGVDLVIVRENTEDLYSGLEHEVVPGVSRA